MIRVMAEGEGFEPPEACASTVFKTAAFDHSAIPRKERSMEATPGFEPGIRALQAPALATWLCRLGLFGWCPRPDLNRHGRNCPRDFKSLVSTNSTTRAFLNGAGDGIRTRDPNLGKVVLYP